MATLSTRTTRVIALAVGLAGCGDLKGLSSDELTPLARIHVRVLGDIDGVREQGPNPPQLRVALLWGQPWLPDASCLPPFESPEHEAVAANGCGDPLGFRRVGFVVDADSAVGPDATAALDLNSLPSALYGDMFSQIVYGSVVVYDDSNGNGFMDDFQDVVHGASFTSMTRPDTRIAFRHGEFDDRSAYYPRRGCAPPAEGYSILSAGGFTLDQAIEAQARGELPAQDPAQCRQDPIDGEITVELRPPDEVAEVGCPGFVTQGYQPPPPRSPDDLGQPHACTSIPDHGTGLGRGKSQLLVAQSVVFNPRQRGCKVVQHVLLRGCYDDPVCETPNWDVSPPPWWPCPPESTP